jgi:hypothetical protein
VALCAGASKSFFHARHGRRRGSGSLTDRRPHSRQGASDGRASGPPVAALAARAQHADGPRPSVHAAFAESAQVEEEAPGLASAAVGEGEEEQWEGWVQCDSCNKWRHVDAKARLACRRPVVWGLRVKNREQA